MNLILCVVAISAAVGGQLTGQVEYVTAAVAVLALAVVRMDRRLLALAVVDRRGPDGRGG